MLLGVQLWKLQNVTSFLWVGGGELLSQAFTEVQLV